MRVFFIFIFHFLFLSTVAQGVFMGEFYNPTRGLGIGVLSVKMEKIDYYNDAGGEKFSENIYTPKEVIPIFFKLDYGIFFLFV